jgi:hypothetical protein
MLLAIGFGGGGAGVERLESVLESVLLHGFSSFGKIETQIQCSGGVESMESLESMFLLSDEELICIFVGNVAMLVCEGLAKHALHTLHALHSTQD